MTGDLAGGVWLGGENSFELAVSFDGCCRVEEDESHAGDHDEVDAGPSQIEEDELPVFFIGDETHVVRTAKGIGVGVNRGGDREEDG